MSVVLQINYAPGAQAPGWSPEQARDVAQQIAAIPVLHWELWIQCETEGTWGGIYLFETEASARAWEDQVRALLAGIGAVDVVAQVLHVDEIETGVERAVSQSVCATPTTRSLRTTLSTIAIATLVAGVVTFTTSVFAADAPKMQPLTLSKGCSQFSGIVPRTVLNPAFAPRNVVLDSGAGDIAMEPSRDLSVVDRLPDDYPTGVGAIITPVFIESRKDLSDRTLSTFLVDYAPGASAILHGMPSSRLRDGSRTIRDDQCFGVACTRRHLSHRRDVGVPCLRQLHRDRKFE